MDKDVTPPSCDDLRRKFKEQFADNIKSKAYHEKDLERLETEDGLCKKFLLHQRQNLDKAAAMVDNSLRWRKEIGVNDLTEKSFPRDFHDLGGVYFHNVDKEGHKILYFQVSKHKKDPDRLFQQKQFIAWWIDKHFQKTPDEPLVVLFDMQGAGISNMDLDLVRFQISCFATYYPALLAYMLIYEMPWVLNAVWKLIKQLLSEEQQKFVIFAKKNDVDKYIARDQLLVHMGGTDTYIYQYLPSEDSGIEVNGDLEESIQTSPTESLSTTPPTTTAARRRVTFAEKDKTLYTSIETHEEDIVDKGTPVSNGKLKSISPTPPNPPNQPTVDADRVVHKGSLLHIAPGDHFTFRVTDESSETAELMTLTNVTNKHVAYKVKTTNPNNYRVKTSSGFIKPNSSVDLNIFLQPDASNIVRDKFLILASQVDDPNIKGQELMKIWKNADKNKDKDTYMEHRLWCHVEVAEPEPMTDMEELTYRFDNLGQKIDTILARQVKMENSLRRANRILLFVALLLFLVTVVIAFEFLTDLFGTGSTVGACTNVWRH